ncbi:hypothetical protein KHP59_03535 [Virgibacillus sp. 19R1-5]|nr:MULTISPECIES: amphi-Trp domain-containing protein [unclassified Virgibacillus]API92235.1 hypothetical protein BKP57_10565 [Virgibacillus sp. 6R]MBS7427167.1 hypothetical protein [Virgibacillus sp. 19R1-5]
MANRNRTNVLVKYKKKMERDQAAVMLQTIATKLKEEGSFTLHQGEQYKSYSQQNLSQWKSNSKKEMENMNLNLNWNGMKEQKKPH